MLVANEKGRQILVNLPYIIFFIYFCSLMLFHHFIFHNFFSYFFFRYLLKSKYLFTIFICSLFSGCLIIYFCLTITAIRSFLGRGRPIFSWSQPNFLFIFQLWWHTWGSLAIPENPILHIDFKCMVNFNLSYGCGILETNYLHFKSAHKYFLPLIWFTQY